MTTLPEDYEEKIGKPQTLVRLLNMDGIEVVVRLQRPFEEEDYDEQGKLKVNVKLVNGKPTVEMAKKDDHIKYGTCLIVEAWCDATKSVITTGIRKSSEQTEETFAFGARYMLNNATDQEIIEVLRIKRLDLQLKYQTGKSDENLKLPRPPKAKKKPT